MEVHIGWASETGNTLDLLREFLAHCQGLHIQVTSVQQLGKETELLPGIWIYFVSTTGQGSPPYRMRPFWKQLMTKNYKLKYPISFAAYSLGDNSYGDHFGMAARKLRQRLKMLGGHEFAEIGLGDDMDPQGYRHAYLKTWRDEVTKFLQMHAKHFQGAPVELCTPSLRNIGDEIEFQIEKIEELSSRKGRRTFWATLNVLGGQAKQGGVAQLFPHNRSEDVEWLLQHWGKEGAQVVEWQGANMTLHKLLTQHLNISSTLNYFFFTGPQRQELASSTQSAMFQDKIVEFGINFEEYFNYIRKYKRNIIDFMRDFELKLDFNYFLSHISEVVGRKYSIAKVQGNRIYLLIKLVEDQITEGRLHRGLCSHDLFRSQGQRRKGKILQGDFLPQEMRPINLLVTLGTGIAPFLWILEQQQRRKWKCMLVYTNSYSDEMHHHRLLNQQKGQCEILSCTREGGLKMVRLLQKEASKIMNFISQSENLLKFRVLYCGPKQIHQYLVTFISELLGLSPEQTIKHKIILHQNW